MDSLIFYWVLTLVVLIILIIITDVGTASIITAFIIIIKFMVQSYSDKNMFTEKCKISIFESPVETKQVPVKSEKKTLPILKPEVMLENAKLLEEVLYPEQYSADDKIFNASVVSGYKEKKAKEIRSHWNNNNWKKFYDYEMGVHEQENRDWWHDDDYELSKKHVVI